ncbi:MAG: ATP-binding protein [Ruminococcus sp.]|nr:ATP-binding protein [Ruminococcus sp.]
MIRKFSVKNYRNFRDELILDFTNTHDYQYNEKCIKNELINKAIIYGKNSVGKSNLGIALYDIVYNTISSSLPKPDFFYKSYKNADTERNDLIEFYYSFLLDNDIVDYYYHKTDPTTVVYEKFVINDELIFEYHSKKNQYNFTGVCKVNAGEINWNEFQKINSSNIELNDEESEKPSALRYIIHNTIQDKHSVIYKLIVFLKGMKFSGSNPTNLHRLNLINLYEEESLNKFQNFLNEYGVDCKLILLEQLDGEKGIYFDYKKPLDFFRNMSSGTSRLTDFYLKYMCGNKPTFIYIDEFDAYYHFELSEKIVKLLENVFDCQVVLTSHNTNLLSNSIMRPDCFMILSNGKITPICDATNRELRQGHNLEKLYINGEFDE